MDGARFAARCIAWSLALFGLLRLSWIELHLVLPLTRLQGAVAVALFGTPAQPVEVTLACSGTDALALCAGAVLAYPARWTARLAGAAGGVALVLALNTVRIGTLGWAAGSPAWFHALHVFLWPAVLVLAVAGYVFAWMRRADRLSALAADVRIGPASPPVHSAARQAPLATRRFVVIAGVALIAFVVAVPLARESAWILALGGFIAAAAAAVLGGVGVPAHSAANVLWIQGGGYLVTHECILTPLVPIYLAAVWTAAPTWRRRLPGLAAAVPLFVALGIVRLLVVALPDTLVGSPLILVHAFYQLLLGVAIVVLAARWRHGSRAAARATAGVAAAVVFLYLLGPLYTRLVMYPGGARLDDPQGALALFPAFQVGLYFALWISAFMATGWRAFLAGLTLLVMTQTTVLLALDALAGLAGLTAHVRDVRGWTIAGPLLIIAVVVNRARPHR
jgi:exosortase/archaeosortase family protein